MSARNLRIGLVVFKANVTIMGNLCSAIFFFLLQCIFVCFYNLLDTSTNLYSHFLPPTGQRKE